jgi:hypothetical protein
MKKSFIILSLFVFLYANFIQGQAPNPPDKICFDYDIAGNRIAQKPAWITIPIDCQCNNPMQTISKFDIELIRIKDINILGEAINKIRDIRWIIRIEDYPIVPFEKRSINELVNLSKINNEKAYGLILDFEEDETIIEKSAFEVKPLLELSIFPNPTEGQFEVLHKGFDEAKSELLIFDSKGSIMMQRALETGQVNVSEYPSGNYILILKDEKNTRSIRFVKQ